MKQLFLLLSIFFLFLSVSEAQYLSQRPLHMSCRDVAINTDYGLLDVQLEIFRKGAVYDTVLIGRKDNRFVVSLRQRSWAWASADADVFVPDGNVFQIGENGKEQVWLGARLAVTQIVDTQKKNLVIVQFDSSEAPSTIAYTTRNCQ